MKKIYILLNLLLISGCFAGSVFAQRMENQIKVNRPDFSGKWKLNFSKSKGMDRFSENASEIERIMIIEQKTPAVFVTIKLQNEENANYISGKFTLYTDGRGDDYLDSGYITDSVTVTKWEKNKIVTTHYVSKNKSPENIISIQEMSLSDDGKVLTETYKSNASKIFPGTEEQKNYEDLFNAVLIYERIK